MDTQVDRWGGRRLRPYTLLVKVTPPAAVLLSVGPLPTFFELEGQRYAEVSGSPWNEPLDILCNYTTREFYGVAWSLPRDPQLCRWLSNNLDPIATRAGAALPGVKWPDHPELDVFWSQRPEIEWQEGYMDLCERMYVLVDQPPPEPGLKGSFVDLMMGRYGCGARGVAAIGIDDLPFVLETWKLVLPERFDLPEIWLPPRPPSDWERKHRLYPWMEQPD